MRLDPHGECLCQIRLAQPEAMLAAQLERSKDVAAQSAAVAGLASAQLPPSYGVVNALRTCLQDPAVYWRWELPPRI